MTRRALIFAAALLLVLLAAAPARADWVWPVEGEVITPYRNGDDPYAAGQHRGIDIAAAIGTTVVAAAGGEVRFAGTAGSSGITVSIRTADGLFDTSYLHLSSTAVRKGQRVATGEAVGAVGTTGVRSAARPHLHFGLRDAGTRHAYHDPLTFLPPPALAPQRPRPTPAPSPVPEPLTPEPEHAPAARPSTRAGTAPTPPAPAATRARRPRGSRAPPGAHGAPRPEDATRAAAGDARKPSAPQPGPGPGRACGSPARAARRPAPPRTRSRLGPGLPGPAGRGGHPGPVRGRPRCHEPESRTRRRVPATASGEALNGETGQRRCPSAE